MLLPRKVLEIVLRIMLFAVLMFLAALILWMCYQALTHIKGPAALIVMAMGLVFAALLIKSALAALWGIFALWSRDEKEPDKTPHVSIKGTGPLLLYKETATSGSPHLTLQGVGQPPDGTFRWSVLAGAEKIKFESDVNQSSIAVRAIRRSDIPEDVVLELTYTTSDGDATAEAPLTVHTPDSAIRVSTNTTLFNGPIEYGYDFTVRYRILDQFGERFPQGFLSLDETLVVVTNPYATKFEERQYISDANAEYDDHYTLTFDYQPVPGDYLARVRQIVRAEGIQFLDHILIWGNTGLEFE